jgi:hypothetical protein
VSEREREREKERERELEGLKLKGLTFPTFIRWPSGRQSRAKAIWLKSEIDGAAAAAAAAMKERPLQHHHKRA